MQKYVVVRKQFLNEEAYQSAKIYSTQLNTVYDDLITILLKHFERIRKYNLKASSIYSIKILQDNQQQLQFAFQAHNYMQDFAGIFENVAHFQMECLQKLRYDNKHSIQDYKLKQTVREALKMCNQCQSKKDKLIEHYVQIKGFYSKFKEQTANPVNFFDKLYIKENSSFFNEKIKQAKVTMEYLLGRKEEIKSLIKQFDQVLMNFKCRLVKNKYSIHKKISVLLHNIKNAFFQQIAMLNQCTKEHQKIYKKMIGEKVDELQQVTSLINRRNSELELEHHSDTNQLWQKKISKSLQIYQQEVQKIQRMLGQFKAYFQQIVQNYKQTNLVLRALSNKMSGFFPQKQSLQYPLNQLCMILSKMENRFSFTVSQIDEMINKLVRARFSCKKNGQIIITLIKIKKTRGVAFMDYQKQDHRSQMQELLRELSFKDIKKNLVSLFQSCLVGDRENLYQMIPRQAYAKRLMTDSMDISHTPTQLKYIVTRKTPLRSQLWMWQDMRMEVQVNFQSYSRFFGQISQQMATMFLRISSAVSMQLQKYNCSLLNNKNAFQGQLQLQSTALEFKGSTQNILVFWNQVTGISLKTRFFKKLIVVTTKQGDLEFTDFEKDTKTISDSMLQMQERCIIGGASTKLQRKRLVELDQQSLAKIKERRQKINGEIPKIDDYRLIAEQTFQGQRIDEIYELFYSDKPFDFYGKEEPCFFSYFSKKKGNYNWNITNYDHKGPQFYTLESGVDFSNAPLASTRTVQYDHPIQSMIADKCHNKENRKIYWISHQEFLYEIQSHASGVPLTDCFHVKMFHRVTKQAQKSVKIQILLKIIFTKETMFKGTIQNTTNPEIDENMNAFLGQIRKLIRLRADIDRGQKVQIQPEPQVEAKPQGQTQVGKLQLYNKILISGLVLLLLINVISWLI